MQSYNLHMHYLFAPGGWAGLKRFLTLQFTLGITLLTGFLHVPFLIVFVLITALGLMSQHDVQIPDMFLFSIAAGYMAGLLGGIVGALRLRDYSLLWDVIFMPVYWLTLFRPTLKALRELRTHPFYWNKTEHGVTGIAS